jgi:hypothetical protein
MCMNSAFSSHLQPDPSRSTNQICADWVRYTYNGMAHLSRPPLQLFSIATSGSVVRLNVRVEIPTG